jgi:hypothetical protein
MTPSTVKPGMPFAGSPIAAYLTRQIEALSGRKTRREIALEIGYDKPNMISMFKRGETKVPLEKIPLLAKALGVDPIHLFRLGLDQYWPDLQETIAGMFDQGGLITDNEFSLIKEVRNITNTDPALSLSSRAGAPRAVERCRRFVIGMG